MLFWSHTVPGRGLRLTSAWTDIVVPAGDVLPLLVDVLRLLMVEHRHTFRPSLEHTAALVAALLPGSDGSVGQAGPQRSQLDGAWGQLTCQALRLLRVRSSRTHLYYPWHFCLPMLQAPLQLPRSPGQRELHGDTTRKCSTGTKCSAHWARPVHVQGVVAAHPVPKKAFLVVASGELLVPLLRCAFPAAAAGPQDVARSEEARSLLQAALFNSSHIPGKLQFFKLLPYPMSSSVNFGPVVDQL